VGLYRWIKVRTNFLLDRVIDLCSAILTNMHGFPGSRWENALRRLVQTIGDACLLMNGFPRQSAFGLRGGEWSIVFIGSDRGAMEIQELLFPDQSVTNENLGRIPLWRIPGQTQRWLGEGIHLVIYESSRIQPWRPTARYAFTTPTWVFQILPIPEPLEQAIAGRRLHGIRHRIRRANREGFGYRFSQSKEDFDTFYHHMYTPFISARYRELALLSPYGDMWRRWFRKGGLVLVTQRDRPVAGSICYVGGETCYTVEGGVLNDDPHLWQQGVNALVDWFALQWGRARGAKYLGMGHSRAWRSNGVFLYKQRWHARVTRQRRIGCDWIFLADRLPPSLHDRLNQIGLVSEIDRKYYGVLLHHEDVEPDPQAIESGAEHAVEQGLAGIVLVSPRGVTTCVASP